jgi:hypothetical protein
MVAVVRILMVLACGPLAVPPVACVCHAADEATAPADRHDGDHHQVPGCPALLCADRAPAAVSHQATLCCDSVTRSFVVTFAPPAEGDFALPTDRFHPSDPPRFLSHCALLR